jgi:hypothetical protein
MSWISADLDSSPYSRVLNQLTRLSASLSWPSPTLCDLPLYYRLAKFEFDITVYYMTRSSTTISPIQLSSVSSISISFIITTSRHTSSHPPYHCLYYHTKLDTNRVINRFRPTLAIWGITAGLGVSLYLSEVPLFQKDVLRKIPFVSLPLCGGTTLNEVTFSLLAALPFSCLSICNHRLLPLVTLCLFNSSLSPSSTRRIVNFAYHLARSCQYPIQYVQVKSYFVGKFISPIQN